MSKIVSIATGLPAHKYAQEELCEFADAIYSKNEVDSRKLKYVYNHSGIAERYSVLPDFRKNRDAHDLFPATANDEAFPDLDSRMKIYNETSLPLSLETIMDCTRSYVDKNEITHLITVSCTGMSAPGLDLQVMEALELPAGIVRTSVNFMGCYAAVHALRLADAFCNSGQANVLVVCTELCTLHFQEKPSTDNITSSLLFADGCAAILVQSDQSPLKGIKIDSFFSDVSFKGSQDMAWKLSSQGFLMTLTGYVPELIKADFKNLAGKALAAAGRRQEEITHWCIHPGGKKILEAISSCLELPENSLAYSYDVLRRHGNMSSATILFVLKEILDELKVSRKPAVIFGAAFGPGLTMETFIATYD